MFWHFLKVVYSRACESRKVWVKVRKLKKSAFIESLKAFQAQNPNFLSNIVNKELSRKYWAYGIIA